MAMSADLAWGAYGGCGNDAPQDVVAQKESRPRHFESTTG
jgi:hypothetical protein